MATFISSGKIISEGWPNMRPKKMHWGKTTLRMKFDYEEGYIKTKKGTKVLAYNFIPQSLKIELFDEKTNKVIPKDKPFFNQFHFDLSYNCFGYCFADSDVFILDPTAFIEEEFEEVPFEEAELILFKEWKGFGDNNEEITIYFHAVKILPNGNVSFKPGINPLVENVAADFAIHNYNFNHEIYIRKKHT